MHTTNTAKRIKAKLPLVACLFICLGIFSGFGCSGNQDFRQAREYARQSQDYYRKAVADLRKAVKSGREAGRAHYELGKLYFNHGDFILASEEFKLSDHAQAKKYLGIAYFKMGRYAEALEVFDKSGFDDDQSAYYHGLSAEKMNLFDQAMSSYKKIKGKEFSGLANERINLIEKQENLSNIRELNPQIHKIISLSASEKEYPQAGALILLADEKVEISPDNRQTSTLHYLVKILNDRGKESYAETQIEYDTTYERIELEYARTIKPDGSIVDVGSRHIRDVSKYLNFPLYSNAHVYIISFPEVTRGAVIEYKLKIYRSQLVNKKDFVLSYPVQSADPILKEDFQLVLPKDKKLAMKLLNEQYNDFSAELNPVVTLENGFSVYKWSFKDVPQILPEPNMPRAVEVNPTILFSTFDDWKEIYLWWWGLAKEKIRADNAIKNKVKELTASAASQEAKLRKIYNYCAQDIRYVAVEYGQAGYEPHLAEDTFRNKYGDCKDKAILLVTMLQEAGFTAWPVLISTRDYYNLNSDFPAVLFNHCIAAVSFGGKVIFMDSTAQTCAFKNLPSDDQLRQVMVFKPQGYDIEITPLFSSGDNLNKQEIQIQLNPDDSISARKSILTTGVYDQAQRYWLLYTPPEVISDTLKAKIQEVSIGAKLSGYDIKNLDNLDLPVELSFSFNGPEYLISAGNLAITPQLTNLDPALVAKESRRYPVDFTILDSKETTFEIAIPSNFAIKYIPENISEDSPWLSFNVEYSRKPGKIYFKQSAALKKTRINIDEYAAFKLFFEGLARKIKQRIILERIK